MTNVQIKNELLKSVKETLEFNKRYLTNKLQSDRSNTLLEKLWIANNVSIDKIDKHLAEKFSNCCGVTMDEGEFLMSDRCPECGEHCDIVDAEPLNHTA